MAMAREKKTFHSPCVAAQRQLTDQPTHSLVNRPTNVRSSLTAVTYVVYVHTLLIAFDLPVPSDAWYHAGQNRHHGTLVSHSLLS